MAFNVDAFKSGLTRGGVRPNLFEVQMEFPAIVGGVGADTNVTQKMTFTCKAASLPEATIGMIDVPYFGRTVKFAGNRTYGEWTTTVFNDEDFAVHDAIRNWIELMNGPASNMRLAGSTRQYQVDASVTQFGTNGDKLKTFRFHNIWPSVLSPVDLDWGSNDQLEELVCTWQYDYWISATGTEGGLVSKIVDTLTF
tara:strand:+ start:465 stop:1052 length:588 start_codon:yes stop_codon:yes gene_type:complete